MVTRAVCVLGGTGFVGTRLCSRLATAGYQVTVPTRDPQRTRALSVLPAVSLVGADIHDTRQLAQLLAGQQVVINLVGILNEAGRDGSGFRHAHAELAEKLVQACRQQRVGRLIQMSSLGADAERGPSYYLKTKGLAERRVREESGADLAWTIFRPSVIFGRGDSFTLRFAGLLRLAPGVLPLACAGARLAPVWIDDVVAALMRALENPATAGETYPLCGPEDLTLAEIVRRVRNELRLRCAIVGLPDAVARLQAAIMDFLPGKPFSTDNYRSLTVDSICEEDGFQRLDLPRHSLQELLSTYLHGTSDRARESYRSRAGR